LGGVFRLAGFLLATALVALATPAAAARGGSCEWRTPAHDPYRGDLQKAVDDYADIPMATRERLKARMARVAFDEVVSIRRDRIDGNARYEPALLDMHFGRGSICRTVTRNSWHLDHEERALAYCEDGHCIAVPLVCHNVSRILRRPSVAMRGDPARPPGPLVFEPPGAGVPAVPPAGEPGPTAHPELAPPAPAPVAPLPPVPGQPLPPAALPPSTSLPPTTPGSPGEPGPLPAPVLPPGGIPPLPPAAAVPEPSTLQLWGGALALAVVCSTKRRRRLAAGSNPQALTPKT
jgi:hypothetical protein